MEDLSRWARQRPGTFLAAAAAIGLVAGRLTRGLADDARDDDDDSELAVPVPFQKPAPRQSRQSKRAATVARLLFTSSATA